MVNTHNEQICSLQITAVIPSPESCSVFSTDT